MIGFRRAAVLCAPLSLLLAAVGPPAKAQFKEIGPPPFSTTVAHQRIRSLLDQVDSTNRQQTIDKLNSWTPWFRNILDEELIAGWQRDSRQRLTEVMEPLADTRVAAAVVEFSWRTRTEATLNPSYASVLGHLMARYPESGNAFLADLLGATPPELSAPQVETVCRILLKMPDLGTWHESALKILPRFRATAERLLIEDRQGSDQEKSYRAQIWLTELRGETPGVMNQSSDGRRRAAAQPLDHSAGPLLHPPSSAESANSTPGQAVETTASNRPAQPLPATASVSVAPANNLPAVQPPQPSPVAAVAQPYNGPSSGTLECSGSPVPQNAEYVFRNLPSAKIQLDYDQRVWEARLMPGENQTQRLILKNKSSGPQKRCVVHWSVVP